VHFFRNFRNGSQDFLAILVQSRTLILVLTVLAMPELSPETAVSLVQVGGEIKDIFGFLKDRTIEHSVLLEKQYGKLR
jgi:hypothetical protein